MQRILITGASGFLGTKLFTTLSQQYNVIGTYYQQKRPNLIRLDITNKEEVQHVIASQKPDVIIHTVALSDPDYCEEHPEDTLKINFDGTKHIVEACRRNNVKLIYISTAGVFDGKHTPYRETDPVCPINKYGESKAKTEKIVQTLPHYVILRFDFLYGYNGPDGANGLIGKILTKKRIEANPVQQRKPLFVDDVAAIISMIIKTDGTGIYHLAGPDTITKYELCKRLEEILGVTGNVYPIEAVAQKAKRAEKSSLLTDRLAELGVVCTPIATALRIIKKQYALSEKNEIQT